MVEALWLIVATVLSVGGMAGLALAMEAHWGQVMRRPASEAVGARWLLRALGAVALLLALLACLRADRPSMAALVWVMLLAGAALAVALTLAWRPRWLFQGPAAFLDHLRKGLAQTLIAPSNNAIGEHEGSEQSGWLGESAPRLPRSDRSL